MLKNEGYLPYSMNMEFENKDFVFGPRCFTCGHQTVLAGGRDTRRMTSLPESYWSTPLQLVREYRNLAWREGPAYSN